MKKPLKELLARIEVKSVKFHRGHEGMDGLNCKLYFDGKYISDVYDDARGGCFEYNQYIKGKFHKFDWMGVLKAYDLSYTITLGDESWDSNYDWDTLVNKKVEEYTRLKDANKGVMVKTHNGVSIIGYKLTIPNCFKKWGKAQMLKKYQGIYDKAIADGKEVLNTKYLADVGVKV